MLLWKWLNHFKIVPAYSFYNFFNIHPLIVKIYELKDKKKMPKIPVDRKMKRDNFEYLHSNKLACCKWLDKRSVTILFSNGEGMAVTSSRASPDGKKKIQNKASVSVSAWNYKTNKINIWENSFIKVYWIWYSFEVESDSL